MSQQQQRVPRVSKAVVLAAAAALAVSSSAFAQSSGNRLLGIDVSAWQGNITTSNWDTLHRPTDQQVGGVYGDGRDFVFIRASRGGTTGVYKPGGGYPSNDNTDKTLSQRYDDPYYIQNINRATAAGMYAGSYHFSRPDILASTLGTDGVPAGVDNSGSDEADHFIQMAGPFMRPGYLPPVHDFEAGDGVRTDEAMAQFCLDFSNRVYQVMRIRPAIYTSGNYAANILGGASASLRNQLAQPAANRPTVVSPAYPQLWSARWPNQANPSAIDVQNGHPKDSYSPIYGPWDDYGTTHPWVFWQYASTARLNGYASGTLNIDVDVVQGGTEFLKDQLIPAVWWNDSGGDWSTLANWNSGQTPVAPPSMPGQLTPYSSGPLPTPRLPGAAGTGTTAGSNDTVILERPSANITVTLSTGTHNIRKMYMRETLNITGGSLTINYVPVAESTPMSAQFSGPVSISGGANLSAHTIYADPAVNFTAGGNANLTLNTLQLQRGTTPAKLIMNGDVNFAGLSGATATIATNIAAGTTGSIDLASGTRVFNVSNGAAATDLDVLVPIANGTLTKSGTGTMKLNVANALSGATTINDGILDVTGAGQLGASVVANMTVTTPGSGGAGHGGTLRLNNGVSYSLPMTINGGGLDGVTGTAPGGTGALDSGAGSNTWAGNITLQGAGVNGSDPTINQVSAAAGATLVLSGIIGDSGGVSALAKSGDGDLVLAGASPNTYGERTRVYGGRLIVEKNGALGAAGSSTGATGNTFQLASSASTIAFRAPGASPGFSYSNYEWINIDGSGNGALGQLDNLGGDNTFAGHIGLSATVDAKIGVSAGSLELAGGIYTRGVSGSRVINKIGGGTLILSGDSGIASTNSLNGALTASTFNVTAGAIETRSPTQTATNLPGVTAWNVSSGATLRIGSGILLADSITVAAGANLTLPAGGGARTLRATNVTALGRIDLADHKMIVDYTSASPIGAWNGSAYGGLTGTVLAGRNGGAWDGNGIVTSMTAAASPSSLTTLGVAEASTALGISGAQTGAWQGHSVDATTVLIKYTWQGDADLSGSIDGDDFFFIDAGYSASAKGFGNGDFNYDGSIDADDYFLIDRNYSRQSGVLAGVSAVPEPGSAILLGAGASALGLRRRRAGR